MHIENNSAYTPPLYTRATDKAANANAEQASTPPPSGSQETAAADTAKAAAVTGVTGSNLSKEMVDQLIAAAQETSASNTDTENYKGILSDIDRRHLDNIASDQKYATEYAELLGNHQTLIPFRLEDYGVNSMEELNYAPESVKRRFDADRVTIDNAREGSFVQRQALYERKQSEGVSPAKTYAALLELTAGQAEFTSLVDKGLNRPEGQTAQWYQAQHDYLQQAIAKANSTKAAG